MPKAIDLIRQGRHEELWQMCCGFTGLNLEQFMSIQKRLMTEQLELLNRCALGKKIMRGAQPATIDEFRQQVPLTTYADYCPELLEKREDMLPARPAFWMRTSGKSGEYPCKWVPVTQTFSHELGLVNYGVGLLSSSSGWGDTSQITGCPRIVYTVAPRPYTSGVMASMLEEESPAKYLPPIEEAESLSFEERIKIGFEQALSEGMDYFFGLALVLVMAGNKFSQASDKAAILPLLARPRALLRLTRGMIKSKLARRRMLPKDLWSVRGIISGGLDSGIYREKIKEYWGRYPLDVYVGTEGGVIATQTWDYEGMTFIPNLNFLEFIPEEELFKWQLDHSYRPDTVLLDEVNPGESYEVVITNFHGGTMIRYRPGDMVRITSLRNENLGIEIPQMAFEGRADGLIDFGVTRLSEKVIWQAIERCGVPYEDWVARKEIRENMALHIYIEPKDEHHPTEAEMGAALIEQLRHLDSSLSATSSDVGKYLDFDVEVSFVPCGSFANYIARKRTEGADLAHLKPTHINPSDEAILILSARPAEAAAQTERDKVPV